MSALADLDAATERMKEIRKKAEALIKTIRECRHTSGVCETCDMTAEIFENLMAQVDTEMFMAASAYADAVNPVLTGGQPFTVKTWRQ